MNESDIDEIKESQKRLGIGLVVVSEMLEKILAELQSGGLTNQGRFQRDQSKLTGSQPTHRYTGTWPKINTGADSGAFDTDHRNGRTPAQSLPAQQDSLSV